MASVKKKLPPVIIDRRGYVLRKKCASTDLHELIKQDLIVKPELNSQYKEGEYFKIYTEDNDNYYLPKFWALENIDIEPIIQFKYKQNKSVNFKFKSNLRYPQDEIIFANGGDRTATNIPELSVPNVIFKFGVGGDTKQNSSSWILNNWVGERVKRIWGEWRVLSQINNTVKIKELIVQPGQKLSMQRHKHRTEFWFVAQGKARVHWDMGYTDIKPLATIKIHENEWHQLENIGSNILHVVEIQHGDLCEESDIERVDN